MIDTLFHFDRFSPNMLRVRLTRIIGQQSSTRLYSSAAPKPTSKVPVESTNNVVGDPEERGGMRDIFTSTHYRHRLSLVEACLRTGQIKRAEIMLDNLMSNYPVLSKRWINVHVYNMFLRAFIRPSDAQTPTKSTSVVGDIKFRDALGWFQRMKKAGVKPNTTTYALLMDGAIQYRGMNPTQTDFLSILVGDFRRFVRENDGTLAKFFQDERQMVEELVRVADLVGIERNEFESSLKTAFGVDHSPTGAPKKDLTDPGDDLGFASSLSRSDLELPLVKPSKASNLQFVKESLNAVLGSDSGTSLYEKQIHIEQESFRINLEQLLEMSEKKREVTGIGIMPPEVKKLAKLWYDEFMPKVHAELEKCRKEAVYDDNNDYASFLLFFERHPEKLGIATISQFMRCFSESPDYVRASTLVHNIGDSIEQEYRMILMKNKKIRDKIAKDYVTQQSMLRSRKLFDQKFRQASAKNQAEEGLDPMITGSWESETKMKVGSVLASLFLQTARAPINKDLPSELLFPSKDSKKHVRGLEWEKAFEHSYMHQSGKAFGIIKSIEAVSKAFEIGVKTSAGGNITQGVMLPKLLPMLVPPKPWIDYQSGGYLTIKTSCVRGMTKEAEYFMRRGSFDGSLNQVYSGLDALGMTKWRINDALLKFAIHAWNTGQAIGKLPVEVPEKPVETPKPIDFDSNPRSRFQWYSENRRLKQEYYDQKSMRATENYKLEIARAFIGKTLYFPHSLDFRGRAYPIPQLFNHIGNDLARSLLIFEEEKPLGENGYKWLKVHLANCFGNDKCTFDERAEFVDQNMDKILATADDPFGPDPETNGWWLKGDKPWMTLSAAIEIARIHRAPNPEEFKSRLPVHQDGSCNGLQHYAALGGDREGAIQVNLAKGLDRPQDVYMAAANIVKELVMKDIEEGEKAGFEFDRSKLEEAAKCMTLSNLNAPEVRFLLAKLLTPERIERKTVKQTVMTSVYGVTFVGAREQIRNRLKEKYYPHTYSQDEIAMLSRYLTPKVFAALNDMFTSARGIQDWLAESARVISRSYPTKELEKHQNLVERLRAKKERGQKKTPLPSLTNLSSQNSVAWTTPIGLHVVQPYRKSKSLVVSTALQTFTLKNQSSNTPVDSMKQVAGFPPNFVHSLDATHMLMTALECAKEEDPITFASVHDSYWTHACDIDRLRVILKEQFVKLHSQPILGNLRDDLVERYADRKIMCTYEREEFVEQLRSINKKSDVQYSYDSRRRKLVAGSESGAIEIKTEKPKNLEAETVHSLIDVQAPEDPVAEMDSRESTPTPSKIEDQIKTNARIIHVWEDAKIPELPKRGNFDVREVLESDYFFS